ncbi:glycosyltransferase family 9 protein [uncultured Rhodospira sp.]|uniref:glycosyltransferase family 9 protein n=1 Tax=uncultured Rhodospira sp. TaxID=1936189 RepID=UPI0026045C22|nr:glycosyltransferase family 9 protein [uncultured Rhodospira sp.]
MKLLFITNSRIGDAVLSTGLLSYAMEHYPGVHITVACGHVAAPLFEGLPALDRLIPMHKKPWGGHWRALYAQTKGTKWDLIIDLRGSPLPWLLWPHRTLRPQGHAVAPDHRLRRIATTVSKTGFSHPPEPHLWTRPEDEAAADAALAGTGDGPILALAPTANWIAKVWPADRFVELARRLTAPDGPLPGARIAVVAAPDEREAAAPVLDALAGPGTIDLVGRLHLLAVAAVFSRCALFVGNDSGLMHMAAAAGAPTVGLFGPSRDEHYAPWGRHCRVARTDKSYDELFPPTLKPDSVTGTLMDTLPVDRVEDTARALLRKIGATTAA